MTTWSGVGTPEGWMRDSNSSTFKRREERLATAARGITSISLSRLFDQSDLTDLEHFPLKPIKRKARRSIYLLRCRKGENRQRASAKSLIMTDGLPKRKLFLNS